MHSFPLSYAGGELLVLNNTRVIPARLFGRRAGAYSQRPSKASQSEHLTGKIEVLLLRRTAPDTWEALVRPGRKLPKGERMLFGEGELEAEILARGEFGLRTLQFVSRDGRSVEQHIERLGHVPLPPYIDRDDEVADRERYQTVFAKHPGAIAAPTAGLHFTPEILKQIQQRGAEICELTLDVGLGTFQPIHSETLEGHAMHAESYEIPEETADRIYNARAAGRPILAVGTTVVRALEAAALRAVGIGFFSASANGKSRGAVVYFSGISLSRGGRAAHEFSSAALDAAGAGLRIGGRETAFSPLTGTRLMRVIDFTVMGIACCCADVSKNETEEFRVAVPRGGGSAYWMCAKQSAVLPGDCSSSLPVVTTELCCYSLKTKTRF